MEVSETPGAFSNIEEIASGYFVRLSDKSLRRVREDLNILQCRIHERCETDFTCFRTNNKSYRHLKPTSRQLVVSLHSGARKSFRKMCHFLFKLFILASVCFTYTKTSTETVSAFEKQKTLMRQEVYLGIVKE